jgi:hypothetical protein
MPPYREQPGAPGPRPRRFLSCRSPGRARPTT